MIKNRLTSRRYRVKKIRTPGGRLSYHHKKKKTSTPKCAECKKPMQAVNPHEKNKSRKRPNRPYAGRICASCLRLLTAKKALNVTV